LIGMSVHPFGDPVFDDEFAAETLDIDVREFHTYAAVWTPDDVAFFVDGQHVKTVGQSPSYPMQFMLGIYEFADERAAPHGSYPKQFTVDYFRGWRRVVTERDA